MMVCTISEKELVSVLNIYYLILHSALPRMSDVNEAMILSFGVLFDNESLRFSLSECFIIVGPSSLTFEVL